MLSSFSLLLLLLSRGVVVVLNYQLASFKDVLRHALLYPQVYLEALFRESSALSHFETGFRGCVASLNEDFSPPSVRLSRDYKAGTTDPYDLASQEYNCVDDNLPGDWKIHPANTLIGAAGNEERLRFALFDFAVFSVSFMGASLFTAGRR